MAVIQNTLYLTDFFCFACLYWQRLGYFMLEHTSATTIGGFRSQPERCNNAGQL